MFIYHLDLVLTYFLNTHYVCKYLSICAAGTLNEKADTNRQACSAGTTVITNAKCLGTPCHHLTGLRGVVKTSR